LTLTIFAVFILLEQDGSRKISHAEIKTKIEKTYDPEKTDLNFGLAVRKILIHGVSTAEQLAQVVHMLGRHSFSGKKPRGLSVANKKKPDAGNKAVDGDAKAEQKTDETKEPDEAKPKYFAQDDLIGNFSIFLKSFTFFFVALE
jgi:hypothetical protein